MIAFFDSFLPFVIPLVVGGWLGYEVGLTKGWRKGIDESFEPFYDEGYYNGWIARHHRVPLEDKRADPDAMERLMPSLITPGQDRIDWNFNGNPMPIKDYRRIKADKLNEELKK